MAVDAPTTTPLANEQPTKSGWHLLRFSDGSAAVVRWDNGSWQWGSQTPPAAGVLSMSYLGTNVQAMSLSLPHYGSNVGSSVWTTLVSSIDHGFLSNGQPIVVSSNGQVPSSGNNPQSQQGSEAVGTSLIPGTSGIVNSLSAIDVSGIWQWLTTPANWVRIGEYVGGAVLIFIAIKGFAG